MKTTGQRMFGLGESAAKAAEGTISARRRERSIRRVDGGARKKASAWMRRGKVGQVRRNSDALRRLRDRGEHLFVRHLRKSPVKLPHVVYGNRLVQRDDIRLFPKLAGEPLRGDR